MKALSRLRLYTSFSQYLFVLNPLNFFDFKKTKNINTLKQNLKKTLKVKYVIPVPLARVGIYLLVKHLLKTKQNEVILSPYTIAEIISIVISAGGKPVFADIDRKTCNISVTEIEKKINKKTGLILITHFYGNACDINQIDKISKKYNIPFIEDCAQAFGGKYKNKSIGTHGIGGVFSFGLYKNINAFYGGAIVTDNYEIKSKIEKEIFQWPMISKYYYYKKVISGLITDFVTHKLIFRFSFFYLFRWAFKNNVDVINNKLKIDTNPKKFDQMPQEYLSNLSDNQAFLINKQLEKSVVDTKIRIKKAQLWYENLLKCEHKIILPPIKTDFSHIYWYFPIQFKNRKKLVEFVQQKGYDISESYHRNCADLNCYSEYFSDCSNARDTANSLIYLPCYPAFPDEHIIEISKLIKIFVK